VTPTVYVARHGETVFNVERRMQGCRCDSPLTELGRWQAVQVAMIVERSFGSSFPPFVVSPLGRTRATATIMLEHLGRRGDDYAIDDRLRELDFGDWTGLTLDEVRQAYAAEWRARARDPWNVGPSNGETYADVATRVGDWLAEQGGEVIAVTHGVVSRVLRGRALGLDGQGIRALDEPHDCLFRIQDGEVVRLSP
jgi:broad specificity phosphatase PhoE